MNFQNQVFKRFSEGFGKFQKKREYLSEQVVSNHRKNLCGDSSEPAYETVGGLEGGSGARRGQLGRPRWRTTTGRSEHKQTVARKFYPQSKLEE